jgi:predicted protein tyrosine phosphatase
MAEKPKILFVCTANKMRSKTAAEIYQEDSRFMVKSAGVAEFAEVPLNLELLAWADYIVVMEERHREWIEESYPRFYLQHREKILNLGIPDIYNFMDPELVSQLRRKFEPLYETRIKTGVK